MKITKKFYSAPIALIVYLSFLLFPPFAFSAPNFQMPFPYDQLWSGSTRTNHNPVYSIDFNRTDDYGDKVVSSASGTVVTVKNLGNTSYGLYVVVDHGGGWSTLYAHLSSESVSVGQSVSEGTKIGAVGNSGGSTGAHLHYEQRYLGSAKKIKFNGSEVYYYGTRNYRSKNKSGSTTTASATGTVSTSGGSLSIRSGPGTGYSVLGYLDNGTKVNIYCQVKGESISGTFGTSNLWNNIGSGRYISDAYTYTGSDGAVAPTCN